MRVRERDSVVRVEGEQDDKRSNFIKNFLLVKRLPTEFGAENAKAHIHNWPNGIYRE